MADGDLAVDPHAGLGLGQLTKGFDPHSALAPQSG
jgi:hypothetical protein